MFKKYKFGFDFWGLLIFLVIMIPNFIWFVVPAPDDVLRLDSVTPIIDKIGRIIERNYVNINILISKIFDIFLEKDNLKYLTPQYLMK